MNIIEKFASITACMDCVKAHFDNKDPVLLICRGQPSPLFCREVGRCDEGLWFFAVKWDSDMEPVIIPMTLERFINESFEPRRRRWHAYRVVPRHLWPEIEES